MRFTGNVKFKSRKATLTTNEGIGPLKRKGIEQVNQFKRNGLGRSSGNGGRPSFETKGSSFLEFNVRLLWNGVSAGKPSEGGDYHVGGRRT